MLYLVKILLKVLCVLPLPTSSGVQLKYTLRYIVKLTIEAMVLTGSFIYVLNHLDDIHEATEPGFVCVAIATTMFIYIWMICHRQSIKSVIDRLDLCVKESKLAIIFFLNGFRIL